MFITEKTTRPMLNLHPQLIYCCTGTLDHLKSMGYKVREENDELFFKYFPPKIIKKRLAKKSEKESPFEVLKNLNLNQ